MDQKPWYQKRKFDPLFPFHLIDSDMQSYRYHWHPFLEVIYVLKGRIVVSVDGQSYEAHPRDIVMINSGVIHGFFNANPNTLTSVFRFGLEFFDQTLIDLRDRVFQKLVFGKQTFFTAEKDGEIHRLLEELLLTIRQEYHEKKAGYRLAVKAKLCEMSLIFLRQIPEKKILPTDAAKRNYNHQILDKVFSFVHENYDNSGITVEQAAEVAAFSKFHFIRFFKEQTGQTFHTYLSKLRVSHAEEYLVETDMAVTDIAYLCGFSSLKTFNRLFKTYVGISPSSYRFGKKLG